MTTFEMPKNPRCTVWTRKGDRFDYDREYNRYQRTPPNGEVGCLSWEELVYVYGPLTDIGPDMPVIGEVFSGPRHFSTLPDHGIFRQVDNNGAGIVAICRNYGPNTGGISYTNSTHVRAELWKGTWERIA